MTEDDYRHYVCIAAGENPDELMKKYDSTVKVEPYVVYKRSDAGMLKQKYIDEYEKLLKLDESELNIDKDYIEETIEDIKDMTDDEFFEEITSDFTIDDETGDAMSDANPNGKFSVYKMGKMLCIPFITKDGQEVFEAKKKDIDWDKIHLANGYTYERVWEMVIDKDEPQNKEEEQLYENMKDYTTYLNKFETKENYIISNTAFWGYAFVSEKEGWKDATESNQFDWMKAYYDRFIKDLPDDTLLTIYECVK
jgi:hypothetical protein